jgi:glutaredoxin
MPLARRLAAAAAVALIAFGAACDASAQQIYKIMGPDGRITFSDKPPAETPAGPKAQPAKVVPYTASASPSGGAAAAFPLELRQAVSRYPVTLYAATGCETCARGRQFLITRGIPFTERLIVTQEDLDALSRLANTQSVPLLTIGSQQLRGFSDLEWTQFLDAAGYPKTSQLPPSYSQAPATPLVAVDQRPAPTAAAAPARRAPPAQAPAPTEPPPENPAGITF